MSNNFIKSSPLDGLQNNLRTSSSVVSFDSILTNSRLLDKLDLSNDDEFLLLEQIHKEDERKDCTTSFDSRSNKTLHEERHFTNLTNTSIPSNKGRAHSTPPQLISMPASQFPSLRLSSNASSNRDLTYQKTIKLSSEAISQGVSTETEVPVTVTSIAGILKDVEFKDKAIQSKVEQHYSNTSRFSYIVEEDTDSINNKILENFKTDNSNPFLRRNHNLSTKSNTSTNTQFSKASLQLSSPLTQTTLDSDLLNPKDGTVLQESPKASPSNDKKLKPPFLKSHKKKSSLTTLKNLFKNNKSKGSSDRSVEKYGSNDNLYQISNNFVTPTPPSVVPTQTEKTSSLRKNKSASKLIFSPHPNFYPNSMTSATVSIQGDENRQNRHHHHSRHHSTDTTNAIFAYDKHFDNNHNNVSGGNHYYSNSNIENSIDLGNASSSYNFHGPNRPNHQRSYSASNPVTMRKEYTSVPSSKTSHLNMMTNETPQKVSPSARKIGIQSSYSTTPSPNEEDIISSVINMRKAASLHASALKLKQACEKGNKTAFLLYGLALRYGYGVEVDYIQSFSYIKSSTSIESWDNDVFDISINPFQLERNLNQLVPTKLVEPLVPALYECGIAYLKGFGTPEVDEYKGLKCLEKAASMGHVDSMCLSGIIWSQDQVAAKGALNHISSKRNTLRKKDVPRAAAWFRIAEKRGASLIGSDWIYKKKYLKVAELR